MRARVALVTAAFFVVCCGSATPAGAGTRCAPAGARIMASGHRVQVYALNGSVYGCEIQSGKRVRLGNSHLCVAATLVDRAAVAGDLVAYGAERCGVDTGSATVSVLRLSDRKQLRSFAAVRGPVGPESFESVNSIVVKRGGAVAWIATAKSIVGHGTRIEVHANGQLLDAGGGIVGSSLRLHGSMLSWRDSGATRSATL
jgi:hypothetical protein